MQLKWLEDLIALEQTRSFSQAAELRHITHPAFGRRIKALEDWAGTPLVERGHLPVTLTAAGLRLLEDTKDLLVGIDQAREGLRDAAGQSDRHVTLATGRTLARTVVADWLLDLKPILSRWQGEIHVKTRSLAETALILERNETDFMLTYHHALLSVQLNAKRYTHLSVAQDRLVPVSKCDANGQSLHRFDAAAAVPYLAYAPSLALGRLVADHLSNHPQTPALQRWVESDSVDALLEYALKGAGVAWLPWSLVATLCKQNRLAKLGDTRLEVVFEVRLYRPKRRLSALAEEVWNAIVIAV